VAIEVGMVGSHVNAGEYSSSTRATEQNVGKWPEPNKYRPATDRDFLYIVVASCEYVS
jgi:hypothetical protein